ncbi:MAG: signal peptidase II [Chlamydiia bacterium]|nr:signal peptidase II [Chlamydiia bacterium]
MNFFGGRIFDIVDWKLSLLAGFSVWALYFIDSRISSEVLGSANMCLYQNNSSMFGIIQNNKILIATRILLLFVSFIFLNIYYKMDRSSPLSLCMFLVLIGGAANLMFMLINGAILDYIVIADRGEEKRLACNISDIVITIGMIGYLYEYLKIIFTGKFR